MERELVIEIPPVELLFQEVLETGILIRADTLYSNVSLRITSSRWKAHTHNKVTETESKTLEGEKKKMKFYKIGFHENVISIYYVRFLRHFGKNWKSYLASLSILAS